MDRVLRLVCQESLEEETEEAQDLMIAAAGQLYRHLQGKETESREAIRYRRLLEEVYRNFQNQELCLHYLAAEILYMNEDYCGRFFQKMRGEKFTKFLLEARISMAEQLLRLEPDMTIGRAAEMTGFAPDGQYFSKVFKKSRGATPSEYRAKMQLGME